MFKYVEGPGGLLGGKESTVFLFIMLLVIGLLLSFFGIVKYSRALYGLFMVIIGYMVSIVFRRYVRDWFSILIVSIGFIVGIYILTPGNIFLGIFLYSLGFGAGMVPIRPEKG